MLRTDMLQITPEILRLIARIDEFKGAWRALGTLAPDRLSALRRVATIESIGSSTRIEGSKLSDREVEKLLSNLEIKSFKTRDEQEVAGYAELMDLVFSSWQDIPFNEYHIKQLHQTLLHHSKKDEREKIVLASLPELSLQIVEFAREHGRITMADAIKLTEASRNTLKQHFRNLVERSHLIQRGSGRGVWYELR